MDLMRLDEIKRSKERALEEKKSISDKTKSITNSQRSSIDIAKFDDSKIDDISISEKKRK
jgi:hypothetical protein